MVILVVKHGLLNRWTTSLRVSFYPNLCKTLRKYLFGHDKGKSMVNFYIVNALGQNLATSESYPILRSL